MYQLNHKMVHSGKMYDFPKKVFIFVFWKDDNGSRTQGPFCLKYPLLVSFQQLGQSLLHLSVYKLTLLSNFTCLYFKIFVVKPRWSNLWHFFNNWLFSHMSSQIMEKLHLSSNVAFKVSKHSWVLFEIHI
jgi:hypothetical protein